MCEGIHSDYTQQEQESKNKNERKSVSLKYNKYIRDREKQRDSKSNNMLETENYL